MKRFVLTCYIMFACALSLWPQDAASDGQLFESRRMQFRAGLTWQGQGVNTTAENGNYPTGISSSQWLYFLGYSYQMQIHQFLGFTPSIDVYTDEYLYLEDYEQAFITQAQTGSDSGPLAKVLGLQINLPWNMYVPISNSARFDLSAGISLLFRIPMYAIDDSEDIGIIGQFLNGEGRFLFLYFEPGFSFPLNDKLGFTLSSRTLLPIWHIWDSTSLPFYDTLFSGLVLGITVNI